MSRAWANGSTRAWRKTRALVLARDGYRCRLKLDGCTTLATHAHHIDGKAAGDDPTRLIAACEPCNRRVGNPLKNNPPTRPVTHW